MTQQAAAAKTEPEVKIFELYSQYQAEHIALLREAGKIQRQLNRTEHAAGRIQRHLRRIEAFCQLNNVPLKEGN